MSTVFQNIFLYLSLFQHHPTLDLIAASGADALTRGIRPAVFHILYPRVHNLWLEVIVMKRPAIVLTERHAPNAAPDAAAIRRAVELWLAKELHK